MANRLNIMSKYVGSYGYDKVNKIGGSIKISNNRQTFSWGWNANGELGDNSTINKLTPVAVCGNHTFCHINSNVYFTLGIDKDGVGWGWGDNVFGQLGINTSVDQRSTPVAVCGNHNFCKILTGIYYFSLSLDENGKIWSWGNNAAGQLGINSILYKSTPVAVFGTNKTFCEISAGYLHSISLNNHEKAWGWGYNYYGQLGNYNIISQLTPVAVCGNHTFCKISAGFYHTIGLDNHQNIWCWGSNIHGELGNNNGQNKSTPVTVCGNHTFCEISAGGNHSLGIDLNGKVWSWGDNQYGQLGNNTGWGVNKSTPFAVCGNHTFCQIFIKGNTSFGIDNYQNIWSWGFNSYGQLGDNSITDKSTPVAVCPSTIILGRLIALKTTPESASNHLSYLLYDLP